MFWSAAAVPVAALFWSALVPAAPVWSDVVVVDWLVWLVWSVLLGAAAALVWSGVVALVCPAAALVWSGVVALVCPAAALV